MWPAAVHNDADIVTHCRMYNTCTCKCKIRHNKVHVFKFVYISCDLLIGYISDKTRYINGLNFSPVLRNLFQYKYSVTHAKLHTFMYIYMFMRAKSVHAPYMFVASNRSIGICANFEQFSFSNNMF